MKLWAYKIDNGALKEGLSDLLSLIDLQNQTEGILIILLANPATQLHVWAKVHRQEEASARNRTISLKSVDALEEASLDGEVCPPGWQAYSGHFWSGVK